ncbi:MULTISPECIES: M48 family metallopeptidase [Pelosinus]|uniref:Peptidase M48 Ste24p n=1 Tax=Pelosinus fermentans B4 TaxID=1149862 RepID=I9L5Y6_9FIRM|nr:MULTISPECIES: M48 family metallopeptidase [Pelosinus]EIW15779.1 peptidase M48 Ste24p [Pelosinus fermentans B4]EIW27515.1 peptidase M48 Ste24p [Pelosinus fermentans A11]
MVHRMILRVGVVFAAIVCIVTLYGVPCAQAAMISTKSEISIGRDVGKQLEKKYGVVDDPALQERVTKIGMSMVAVSDRKDLPYSFKVLNSKDVNAMAAPGGFIYIFKGLVDLMPSDDELAGVIGHEIGHVVKRHSVKQIEKNLLLNIGFIAVFGDKAAILQNLAMNAIMAGYSRSDEREADYLGYVQSSKAGYNPYSMKMGLMKLASLEKGSQSDLFSDHPESKERIALVQNFLDKDKIHPKAQLAPDGTSGLVVDGAWQLPTIRAEYGGYKPLYRAYFVAGSLYRISQLANYNPDKYILDYDGENVILFYDDIQILTITPEDAMFHGMSVMDLAGSHVDKLKEWNPKAL